MAGKIFPAIVAGIRKQQERIGEEGVTVQSLDEAIAEDFIKALSAED